MPRFLEDRSRVLRWLVVAVLMTCFVLLQRELWFGQGGLLHGRHLAAKVEKQRSENAELEQRNEQRLQEVKNLKSGTAAIEEHARTDLGLVKKGETFYQIVHAPGTARAPLAVTSAPPRTAPHAATGPERR